MLSDFPNPAISRIQTQLEFPLMSEETQPWSEAHSRHFFRSYSKTRKPPGEASFSCIHWSWFIYRPALLVGSFIKAETCFLGMTLDLISLDLGSSCRKPISNEVLHIHISRQ